MAKIQAGQLLLQRTRKQRMKRNKNIDNRRVNICWECGDEKKCVTLSKEEAYATKRWVDDNGGVVFWFQALDD